MCDDGDLNGVEHSEDPMRKRRFGDPQLAGDPRRCCSDDFGSLAGDSKRC